MQQLLNYCNQVFDWDHVFSFSPNHHLCTFSLSRSVRPRKKSKPRRLFANLHFKSWALCFMVLKTRGWSWQRWTRNCKHLVLELRPPALLLLLSLLLTTSSFHGIQMHYCHVHKWLHVLFPTIFSRPPCAARLIQPPMVRALENSMKRFPNVCS